MTVSFSTATVDQRSQLTYWREVVCATFVRLDVLPPERATAGFRARVSAESLGGMRVATVTSQPHAVFRSPHMIRTAPDDDVFVNLAVRGRTVVAQDGREAVLRPGDFTVYDSARTCLISCPDPFRLVVLKVPRDLFISRYPLLPGTTATTVRGDRGVGALFSSLLRGVPAHVQGLQPETVGQVGVSVLELLATALSEQASGVRPALPREAQLLRARRYITDHLGDPELSPSAVAAALGLSVRYLHALFRAEESTPYGWILERRLDQAARMLADPRQAGRSVTDIAFTVGFKDSSHFSRAFKDRYGVGPRGYRGNRDPRPRGTAESG
jgi:AraC-like DNA-binding protein